MLNVAQVRDMMCKHGAGVTLVRAEESFTVELYRIVDESRQHLAKLSWAATVTESGLRKHLRESSNLWVVKNNDQLCGCLQLRDEGEGYSIGYWIGKEFAGRGIMKAAVAIAVGRADKPIAAHLRMTNAASRRVLESNGFKSYPSEVSGWIRYKTA